MKSEIRNYIKNNYEVNTPILNAEIRSKFMLFKDGTIRQVLRRFVEEGWLSRSTPGTFFIPDKSAFLDEAYLMPDQIVEKKYIKKDEKIVGYISGLSMANEFNLTTQTSPVIEVVSNVIATRKRQIIINKRRVILRKARVKVDDDNWRFLQVMDMLARFESYSELDILTAKIVFKKYLKNVTLDLEVINDIVSKYPVKAQLNFYKMGELFS